MKRDQFISEPLTEENIEAVYDLFKKNEPFFIIPLEFFRRGTLNDKDYDPNLTIILLDPQKKVPIAAFIVIIKKGLVKTNCYLKACMLDKAYRRKGIGSEILKEIMRRAKLKLSWYSSIRYGDSLPRYWQPGVDLRHTALLFFLKKHGFKTHGKRVNLTVPLNKEFPKPSSEKKGITYKRVQPEEYEPTIEFVRKNFRLGFWSKEVPLSFENDPPTTFIAKDSIGTILGWATHSNQFPGSFGPTGVKKSERGKGIGGELLRWCIWDMQQMGLDTCTILWVEGNTIKFYSKVLGAYIHPVFYPISRRL